MAVVQQSIVGITSNPDPRPAFGASTFTVPGNNSDPRARDVTYSASGRKPVVSIRNANPYAPGGATA